MRFSDRIQSFVKQKSSLAYIWINEKEFELRQAADNRRLILKVDEIEEVLQRTDQQHDEFLQINLSDNRKILVTKNLIGFKPFPVDGLDLGRLPKVVTTLDLVSVVEAIEDLLASDLNSALVEVDILKRVYLAILYGAENIGFDLEQEKRWLVYSFNPTHRASA